MKTLNVGVAVLAAVAVGACSDINGSAADAALNADVAVVASDATLDGLRVMQDPGMGMHGLSLFGLGLNGLDRTHAVEFLDATGAQQDHYDPLTTASIHLTHDVSGSVTRESWSATVERHRDMVVSGLEGEETTRTWNGTGSEVVSRSRMTDGGTTRTFDLSGDFTIADVVVPVGGDQHWPLSGTITRHWVVKVTGGANGDQTRERTVVVTFNGTQTVTVNVNGDEFDLDLSTRPGILPHLRLRGRMGRG
jgi:hypothetical protein